MISNELLQAAVITKLKADTTLTAWLTARSSSDEIRELQYQGSSFAYPAVRVQMGTQVPDGETSVCYLTNGEVPFTVSSFSEGDSSLQADQLAGLVNTALLGQTISGSGFRSLKILSDGLIKATRTGERLWQANSLYRCYIYAV